MDVHMNTYPERLWLKVFRFKIRFTLFLIHQNVNSKCKNDARTKKHWVYSKPIRLHRCLVYQTCILFIYTLFPRKFKTCKTSLLVFFLMYLGGGRWGKGLTTILKKRGHYVFTTFPNVCFVPCINTLFNFIPFFEVDFEQFDNLP